MNQNPERAYLIGVEAPGRGRWPIEDSLRELTQLAETAGVQVVGRTYQKLSQPNPATYIGRGKVKELMEELESTRVGTVIFDDELSPGQLRNMERLLERQREEQIKVIDRTALILEIFRQHAHSREGQIQVELAQYEYRLPRLTRLWTHLVRQTGGPGSGVGLRGPGETQLESDRRQIRRRIASLKKELEEVRRHRQRYYRRRKRSGIRTITLVGYTNAGKSSLLNALNRAGEGRNGNVLPGIPAEPALVADQLFATLDPTTRRVRLPGGTQVLVTDTVGFIKKLPHNLVAAFRATLEGIAEADLLLHVIDSSHPKARAQIQTVNRVLADLGVADKPTLMVWNKLDLILEPAGPPLQEKVDECHISALRGQGIFDLLERIESRLREGMIPIEVSLPYSDGGVRSRIIEQGIVERIDYGPGGAWIRAYVPPVLISLLKPYSFSRLGAEPPGAS